MILVGDVGGTHTRLALAGRADDGWRITDVEVRGTTPDILAAVAGFVQIIARGRVEAAAFSGAGTVVRCANCDNVLAVVVDTGDRAWIDLAGVSAIEVRRER